MAITKEILDITKEAESFAKVASIRELTDLKALENRAITKWTVDFEGRSFGVLDYGGVITSLFVPDKEGKMHNVLLTPKSILQYIVGGSCFNAIVGRVTNRIKGAHFTLDGKVYRLMNNDGENCLHGGLPLFSKVFWQVEKVDDGSLYGVVLKRRSANLEQGFPGNCDISVTYAFDKALSFNIIIEAVTDAPTPISMTCHTYYNLAGGGDVLNHSLCLMSDKVLFVDKTLCPTGDFVNVAGTPFDFRKGKRIGQDIDKVGSFGGYDHCYVIGENEGDLRKAATVSTEDGELKMTLSTNQEALQFYTANYLGDSYPRHPAFCLETQRFTNAVNIKSFPSCILRPGEVYKSITKLDFGY